jgi:hypothetical protein
MYAVYKQTLMEEIQNVSIVTIQFYWLLCISQFVMLLWFVKLDGPVERFFSFFQVQCFSLLHNFNVTKFRFKFLTSSYLRSLPMFVCQYLYSEPLFIFFTVRRVTSYVHIIYLYFKHFYHLSYLIRCDTEVKTSALKQLIFHITSHMEVKLTLIWMCNTCKFHIR